MTKLTKRFMSFLLVVTMILGSTVCAYAAEPTADEATCYEGTVVAEYTIEANDSGIALAYDNPVVSMYVSNGSTGYMYPSLASYVGVSRYIAIATSSSSSSGIVYLYLYNPSGKLISDDWMMGVNDSASWSFVLPSSGTYTLKAVVAASTASVQVVASWQG